MTEPLSSYVNYLNDKIDEHKIKATAIEDYRIIDPEDKVFCTFFYLQGDVASPFQFYMTDSSISLRVVLFILILRQIMIL